MMSFMSIGFTVIGTFVLAILIGEKTGNTGAALIIAGLMCILYIISLIKNEIR